MFLRGDGSAVFVFHHGHLCALAFGDSTVGLSGRFSGLKVTFALFKLGGLGGCQRAGLHALLDSFFLNSFTLVDHRRVGGGRSRLRPSSRSRGQGNQGAEAK